jgi:hypothetical protein
MDYACKQEVASEKEKQRSEQTNSDDVDSNDNKDNNKKPDSLWKPTNESNTSSGKDASSFQQCVPTPGHPCQESNTGPNWGKFSVGVVLGAVDLALDALVIVSVFSIPEFDALLVVDAIGSGIPLTSALIFIHVEAYDLITDGYNGR